MNGKEKEWSCLSERSASDCNKEKSLEKSLKKLEIEKSQKSEKRKSAKNKRDTIVELTRAALMTAVLCVLAPFTIYLPFSPVGITLGSLLIYLTGLLLGPKLGCISIFLYLCMGFCGLPVFSGFVGGAGVLFGPTGGFLIGYIPCVASVAAVSEKTIKGKRTGLSFLAGMITGTVVLYTVGVLWFMFVYGGSASLSDAVAACIVPFLLFDGIKIGLAAALYQPVVRLKKILL